MVWYPLVWYGMVENSLDPPKGKPQPQHVFFAVDQKQNNFYLQLIATETRVKETQ